jgi:phosphoribosylamine--glycine ligase
MASDGSSLCVVLTSGGYPGEFMKGMRISGLDDRREYVETYVFHSGTASDGRGGVVTNGGRVLSVVGVAPTFESARERAYGRIGTLIFNNMHYRSDIGWSELNQHERE